MPAPGMPTPDDPALANVWADLNTWVKTHPCDCEAICTCDRELLARRLWRIGVQTLWQVDGRFFVRLDNRTYHAEYEITRQAAMRRYRSMRRS